MSQAQTIAPIAVLHWIACVVVLAEALNKLERADLFAGRSGLLQRLAAFGWLLLPLRWRREHIVKVFKIAGWSLLAMGAAGGLIAPFINLHPPSSQDVAVIAGFALLIVRSRIKEG